MFCTRDIPKCICTVTEVISACFFFSILVLLVLSHTSSTILYVVIALSVSHYLGWGSLEKCKITKPTFCSPSQHVNKSGHHFYFIFYSYRQCMHITDRLLNICYLLEKTKNNQKNDKKYSNKLTFQMQRCRLQLTALTLQSTR